MEILAGAPFGLGEQGGVGVVECVERAGVRLAGIRGHVEGQGQGGDGAVFALPCGDPCPGARRRHRPGLGGPGQDALGQQGPAIVLEGSGGHALLGQEQLIGLGRELAGDILEGRISPDRLGDGRVRGRDTEPGQFLLERGVTDQTGKNAPVEPGGADALIADHLACLARYPRLFALERIGKAACGDLGVTDLGDAAVEAKREYVADTPDRETGDQQADQDLGG